MALVRRARAEGRRIRPLGSSHSWSDVARGEDIVVDTAGLSGVRSVDLEAGRAVVRSGTVLRELVDALAREGAGPSIVGSVLAQTVGGAISTGTHGSSLRHGTLSQAVRAMRVVTGTGEVMVLEEGDARLDAFRVGLGVLGLVTEVTLAVEPAFRLRETATPTAFDEAIDAIPELAAEHEYVKLFWVPHTDRVQVFTYARTDAPVDRRAVAQWADRVVVNRGVLPALVGLGNLVLPAVPAINRLIGAAYFRPSVRVGPAPDVLSLAMPPIHREVEYGVPLERAGEAVRAVRAAVDLMKLRVNFIWEIRFVPGDDTWMSPAFGRAGCQVGIYGGHNRDFEALLGAADPIMESMQGRPHWGKEQRGLTPSRVHALWPKAREFVELARSLDPDRVFVSPFAQRTLAL